MIQTYQAAAGVVQSGSQSIQYQLPGQFKHTPLANDVLFGATSGTVSISLPKTNLISYILLRVKDTNGATSNTGQTVEGSITNISVIGNGTDTIASYPTAELARKVAQGLIGRLPEMDETQAAAGVQFCDIPIYFGRAPYDPMYMLPAAAYSSLILNFDFTFTDNSTTGFASSNTNAKYAIEVIENKNAALSASVSQPYLRRTQFATVSSTASSGDSRQAIPRAGDYRRVYVYAYKAATEDGSLISNIKLSMDNDSYFPVDCPWLMLQDINAQQWGLKTEKDVVLMKADTNTYASKVMRQISPRAHSQVAGHNATISSVTGDTDTLNVYDTATPSAVGSAEAVLVSIRGYGASGLAFLDFDPNDDMSQPLHTSGLTVDPQVVLTQAASAGVLRLVGELVAYPKVN